ncbi:DEAD/DEAH box helicase [Streptomyces scabiei]|uniref:DEAD/DEAH box helicase n=1 Tax=Streptomyces scabiei TaxID=1930 RepID=UPI0029B022AE|nr:DEAD/DEAH box helicase [Streptomyces scabiei]MDX3116727.1 DEAD/DEAH box helicase [Streptomyces scabiei]
MRPTLAARTLRDTTVEYLTTTFALAEPDTQDALEAFLTDPADGLFRGPYLRVRRPFRPAEDGWQRHLDWWPGGFQFYAHQAEAFARLNGKDGHRPEPTLVTTGTGSGKTESFLVPVLDHCRRAREAGKAGIKAVLLYPMNALAGDQAGRLGDLFERDDRLRDVTAGLYIGEASAARGSEPPYGRVMVDRAEIRRNPPDILITNYKMLDLLLQRQQDASLWRDADLAYVVIDEFHTFDGAQGTDVAMLLRRLAAVVGAAEKGRPLGSICPVATSATLGSGGGAGGARAMLDVASQVFGVRFPDDAVVGEDRRDIDEFLSPVDHSLPLPSPEELAGLPDPVRTPGGMDAVARATLGCDTADPRELGRRLLAHPLTHALLHTKDAPLTALEVLEGFDATSAWRAVAAQEPERAASALARFVALISVARDPDAPADRERPLLLVETHLWLRALSRVLRFVSPEPVFSWSDADQAALAEQSRAGAERQAVTVAAQVERRRKARTSGRLPAAYCRHCGRSGWSAICPDRNPQNLVHAPDEIYRASVAGGAAKGRVRAMIAATPAEAAEQARATLARRAQRGRRGAAHDATLMVLEDNGTALRRLEPDEVLRDDGGISPAPDNGVYVWTWFENQERGDYSKQDRCPACGQAQGIRFLGAGVAPLASVVVTQLFTGGELPDEDEEKRDRRKTLIFNDSVQDAAHRAGFVASRAWKFSLRSLIHEQLSERVRTDPAFAGDGVPLNELIASLVSRAAVQEKRVLASVVPPDLHDVTQVKRLLEGRKRIPESTWELVGQRLAFNTLLEFGLHSRLGRTLELTRTVAAEVHLPDPGKAAKAAEALFDFHKEQLLPAAVGTAGGPPAEGDPERLRYFEGYVRGLLEHIRQIGGIHHAWLDDFIDGEGRNRYPVWNGRPTGMPAFGRNSEAPAFVLVGARSGNTDFERVDTPASWYVDFTQRCLELDRQTAGEYLAALFERLAHDDIGALARRRTNTADKQSSHGVYGLTPGHVRVRPLDDEQTALAVLTCRECGWTQTVPPERASVWQGTRCPLKRCEGVITPPSAEVGGRAGRDHRRSNYYRRLYREAKPYSVVAAEHTGVLKRKEREEVEKGFRRGVKHTDPNVLSCTPTLELGIDIGQLESVILASLPPSTAGYVQRVGRAGRATGNAFTVSLADTSPRALYHLAEPRHLIAGPILPPGCFLSAGELLCRQYTAFLIDRAARGALEGVIPLPDRVTQLVGRTGWLKQFRKAAVGRLDLADAFLRLFPEIDGVPGSGASGDARKVLRRFAAEKLGQELDAAERAWEAERAELVRRRDMINEAADALQESVDDEAREKRTLIREATGVTKRLQEMAQADAQGFLVEHGLLPNYSLVEDGVRLEAMLTFKEPARPARTATGKADAGGAPKTKWSSEPRVYDRPAEAALTELAPGNAYYVRGYRHVVDGFDLGPARKDSQAGLPVGLRTWRICRECGHVRTGERAEQDTSPCPRCGGHGIGGRSAVFQVVVPRKVTAHDKRDDARIVDDHENRVRTTYTTVTAVDVDPQNIKETWRHKNRTFGVDHVREAVIRRFNLGKARHGRPKDTYFAGTEVAAPTRFTVCPRCGGATDREPGNSPTQASLSQSLLGRPELAHHRPWCPTRRRDKQATPEDVQVITATEHRTEALRILLPAATLNVPERLASFSAALHLGLARRYGGDPAHIRSAPATEPDRDSDLTRNYLVLYDALPGGTGYLQRLVEREGEEFRAVLAEAQEALRACSCRDTPSRPACHLCLLGYAPERDYKDLSRQEALWMLDDLLGADGHSGWDFRKESADAGIRFAAQAESDLERRFIAALDRWLDAPENGAPAGHEETPTGRQGKQFALTRPGGGRVHWEVVAQKDLHGYRTRPDLLFRPVAGDTTSYGAPPLPIAVYLDGYRWHASSRTNRIAADAAKRALLRADGILVWQITWDDVVAWEKSLKSLKAPKDEPAEDADEPRDPLAPVIAGPEADAAWPPYDVTSPTGPGAVVRKRWSDARRDPSEVDALLYGGAIPSLLGFLRDPRPNKWQQLAQLAVSAPAFLRRNDLVDADPVTATGWIEAAVRDEPAPAVTGQGLKLLSFQDGSGLPLVLAGAQRADAKALRWSALAVLDDRPEAVEGDRTDHRRRWKAWLSWGNIIQFLDPTGAGQADGLALARSTLDAFDAALLAATAGAGTGLLAALRANAPDTGLALPEDLDAADDRPHGVNPAAPEKQPEAGTPESGEEMTSVERTAWQLVVGELSTWGDPEVAALAKQLSADEHVPAGKAGWDVDGISRTIELAWPAHKIGIVLGEDAEDTEYMAQCASAGWHVRAPGDWDVEELARLLGEKGVAQ